MVAPQHSRRESVTYILAFYVCIVCGSRSQDLDAPRTPCGSELQRATGTLRSPKLARMKLATLPTDQFNLVAHL